jgi:hypothetical protein
MADQSQWTLAERKSHDPRGENNHGSLEVKDPEEATVTTVTVTTVTGSKGQTKDLQEAGRRLSGLHSNRNGSKMELV